MKTLYKIMRLSKRHAEEYAIIVDIYVNQIQAINRAKTMSNQDLEYVYFVEEVT